MSLIARYPGTCARCARPVELGHHIERGPTGYRHVQCSTGTEKTPVVFRLYASDQELLYAGVTTAPEMIELRTMNLRSSTDWAALVQRSRYTAYDTRAEAEEAHRQLVEAVRPTYNVKGNPDAHQAPEHLLRTSRRPE